jgi:hypothetical protein
MLSGTEFSLGSLLIKNVVHSFDISFGRFLFPRVVFARPVHYVSDEVISFSLDLFTDSVGEGLLLSLLHNDV